MSAASTDRSQRPGSPAAQGPDPEARRELDLGRRNARRRTPRYPSIVLHWLSRLVRRPAQPAAMPTPRVGRGQVAITFVGHASAVVRYANLAIACDPMLGGFAGAVRREVAPGLSPAELGDVDLVLISHAGPDHLHLPTLAALPRSATVVVPPHTASRISPLGFARLIELSVGQSFEHRRIDVTAAAVRRGGAAEPALAYVIRGDGPSVFYCGDSGYFSGFADIGRRFRPDIALLPIGGYSPAAFRERHMSPLDALFAFEDLQARLMIPIRHGAFALSYELLHDPERWLAELVAERGLIDHVLSLAPGESRLFALPGAVARRSVTEGGTPAPTARLPTSRPASDFDLVIDLDAITPTTGPGRRGEAGADRPGEAEGEGEGEGEAGAGAGAEGESDDEADGDVPTGVHSALAVPAAWPAAPATGDDDGETVPVADAPSEDPRG